MENQVRIYPEDKIVGNSELDVISTSEVTTLDQLFRERVRRTPNKEAFEHFVAAKQEWQSFTWAALASEVERWQVMFQSQGLTKGDRVAIRLKNSVEWVVFDQAALRLGLVVVPLYCDDRPDNVSYVLKDSGSKLLLVSDEAEWREIRDSDDGVPSIENVLLIDGDSDDNVVSNLEKTLPERGAHLERGMSDAEDLASIVYTSGTTGKPKGVMLSHKNMLTDAYAGMQSVPLYHSDSCVSFLPLSHTLERTVGYYCAVMCGAKVVFTRGIPELSEDLLRVKPTYLVSVPRIFERVNNKIYAGVAESSNFKKKLFKSALDIGWHRFEHKQGRADWDSSFLLSPVLDKLVGSKIRAKLGGRIRFAVVGGAPLSPSVAKTFIGLGVNLLQGFGLTECSPVLSVNTASHNKPDTIGLPLRGIELAIGENKELMARGDVVMMGYWNNPEATKDALTEDGWLHTGDQAEIDDEGYVRIIGRIKDILVLANGEKMPPADMESAIAKDTLFEQVMVVGEGKSFLSVLIVLSPETRDAKLSAAGFSVDDIHSDEFQEFVLNRVSVKIEDFPGYAKIRKAHVLLEEWTVDEGLITPTLKLKRPKIMTKYQAEVDALYEGHGIKSHS